MQNQVDLSPVSPNQLEWSPVSPGTLQNLSVGPRGALYTVQPVQEGF